MESGDRGHWCLCLCARSPVPSMAGRRGVREPEQEAGVDPDRGGFKQTVCAKCYFSWDLLGGLHIRKTPGMDIIRIIGILVV